MQIFIGYDPREAVAYHTLAHSIISRSSIPLRITPLALKNLKPIFDRPRDPLQSTDFAFSRFLVPHLAVGHSQWALFMDCDMLMLDDVANLTKGVDVRYAVNVVKHKYKPRTDCKFLGAKQTPYARKNWSSFMLFNLHHPRLPILSPKYVETAPGLDLHQFAWVDDDLIGPLPTRWNWLAGEYEIPDFGSRDLSVIHYTLGGPYFRDYETCDFHQEWFAEYFDMKAPRV